ncbi:SIR2 family protein [Mycobacterium sp. UM_CSW]|uniref:SIR2 family protein n=1 Tax=Mycobacterium sp. UM_CSW TaxID=1370119 RepID=UPI0004022359|nr:SIR2 family protein [Mycobacterium sp. UM_CSW]
MTGLVRDPNVGFFDDQLTREAVVKLAACNRLTFFVGAGASLDLNLPTWSALVSDLLKDTISANFGPDSPVETICAELVNQLFQVPAASVIDSLLFDEARASLSGRPARSTIHAKMLSTRNERLRKSLYKRDRFGDITVGPTLVGKMLELAILLRRAGVDVHIVTTNYDNAFEEAALHEPLFSIMSTERLRLVLFAESPPEAGDLDEGDIPVVHIHGLLRAPSGYAAAGHNPIEGKIVFSEVDYIDWETGDFRTYLTNRVQSGGLLTIGASLRDNNIVARLRDGTRSNNEPRYALMPSESEFKYLSDKNIAEKYWMPFVEMAARRGFIFGVSILRPDFYGQVFQFLQELGVNVSSRINPGTAYVEYRARIRQWAVAWSTVRESDEPGMRGNIETACRHLAVKFEALPQFDHCKVEVWARCEPDDRTMRRWCSSQSTWRPDAWPHTTLIRPLSKQNAVMAFSSRGTVINKTPGSADRRWTHCLTVPVFLDGEPWLGLPVGALEILLHESGAATSDECLNYLRANATPWVKEISKLGEKILTPEPWVD